MSSMDSPQNPNLTIKIESPGTKVPILKKLGSLDVSPVKNNVHIQQIKTLANGSNNPLIKHIRTQANANNNDSKKLTARDINFFTQ